MTDPSGPSGPTGPDDQHDRAERALRHALDRRAGAFAPQELTIPTRVRRRRTWLPVAAAAVLLAGFGIAVGVVGAGGGSQGSGGGHGSDSEGAAAPAGTGWASPVMPGDRTAGPRAAGKGSLGRDVTPKAEPPDPTMQWVSRYDVEVQVPSSWVYAAPSAHPDCIQRPGDRWDDAPRKPYVAEDVTGRAVDQIRCPPRSTAPAEFGELPFELWQPSLSFTRGGPSADLAGDGTWTYRGWTLTRWTVSDVQLTLLTGPGNDHLAARVRDSARTFTVDANGCPATSPVQGEALATPPAVTSASRLTPRSISVCQYRRGTDGAGLIGSRRVTGSAMGALLRGIAQAPEGSGPDATSGCDVGGGSAIELRYDRGGAAPASAYVYYGLCHGDGVRDADSTDRLTPGDCTPLFAEPPITTWDLPASLDGICRR